MRALLPLLVLLSAIPARAQDPALEAIDEVIDVRVLNLEVAVRDKDGGHIEGLTPKDFRLTVDGKEIPIEYFSEIRQGAAMGAPAPETIGGGADVRVVPTVTPGEAVGNSILLFIDNYFGLARDRRIVLEELIKGLADLGPKDRMAVVAFDGRELELRVAVLDEKGDRSEIPVIPVILQGENRPPPGAHAIYDATLKLRNISQKLALALYDVAGEKILSTSIDLDRPRSTSIDLDPELLSRPR